MYIGQAPGVKDLPYIMPAKVVLLLQKSLLPILVPCRRYCGAAVKAEAHQAAARQAASRSHTGSEAPAWLWQQLTGGTSFPPSAGLPQNGSLSLRSGQGSTFGCTLPRCTHPSKKLALHWNMPVIPSMFPSSHQNSCPLFGTYC